MFIKSTNISVVWVPHKYNHAQLLSCVHYLPFVVSDLHDNFLSFTHGRHSPSCFSRSITESSVGGPSSSLSVSLLLPAFRIHVNCRCSLRKSCRSAVSSRRERAGRLPPRCMRNVDGLRLIARRWVRGGQRVCSVSYTLFALS